MGRYRGRWNPSFVDDYVKLRNRVNREYGEREYNDKFKVERSPGMLRQPEVDYTLEIKPYVPENREKKVFSLEIDEKSQKENILDRIEELERERILKDIYKEAVPLPVQREQSLPKVQKIDEPVERSENVEPMYTQVKEQIENKLQCTERSENIKAVQTNIGNKLEVNPMEKDLLEIETEIVQKNTRNENKLEIDGVKLEKGTY